MTVLILVIVLGAASALIYLLRRKWTDAALVLTAAAALGGMLGNFTIPGTPVATAEISAGAPAPVIGDEAAVRLSGDGLRTSQWDDLPARRLDWTAPADAALRLDFPRAMALGRVFKLSATLPGKGGRKLQLLAENGKVIAEAAGIGETLAVQWLPPVAETLVLKARLLNAAGQTIAEGPVPVDVRDPVPLQVQGRFGAPSFDTRTLNQLLAQSNALLDWQVTLGKVVTRSEAPRAAIGRPDLLVVDAAYMERLAEPARASLLVQVASGTPLLILGASANEPAAWSRMLKLELREQPESKPSGSPLALATASMLPVAKNAGGWVAAGDRIWTRPWEKGRIAWLGAGDWHRYAIAEPRVLGLWWQDVLDTVGVRRAEPVNLIEPEEMPLPGQRLALCAHGIEGAVTFPSLKQTLAWQRRPDRADAACVAVWPAAPGWLSFQSGAQTGRVYVYANDDWPLWQKAGRRDATLRYAARTATRPGKTAVPLPAWPFALVFTLLMLLLWWRERR
jgi:hypothetical protein